MSHRAQVWVALWIVYVVWGSTYLGIELAGETIPALFGAGVRFTIVGLIVCGIVIWRRGLRALKVRRVELASAALVGLLLPGANSILFLTEQKVPIGLTSLIIASVPLWVLLFRLAAGERPDRIASLGLLVGFVGIVVLVRPGGGSGPLGYLLLTVLAAISWALGSFLSPRMAVPRDALVATGYETLVGGLVLGLIGLATTSPSRLDPSGWSSRSIFGLIYLILIGSVVGYTAYAWLLGNAPIAQVSTYAYVNPVIAIALGVIVLDETVTARIIAGAVLILIAVAIVVRRESEPGEVVGPDGHAAELAPARRS
ncbi:MAG TPA: EamA family transporter [Gaiellaceae bacterium]|nr:EamA family transporter [Gaiellaceae bacterium]